MPDSISVNPEDLTLDTEQLVRDRAKANGVDPEHLTRIAKQESGFKQSALSPKGAIGVMQLMPDTARGLGVDPHDERQNIEGGAKYFRSLMDRYKGDRDKASAAYNAGPGRVDRGGTLPKETQDYVQRVSGKQQGIAVDASELTLEPSDHSDMVEMPGTNWSAVKGTPAPAEPGELARRLSPTPPDAQPPADSPDRFSPPPSPTRPGETVERYYGDVAPQTDENAVPAAPAPTPGYRSAGTPREARISTLWRPGTTPTTEELHRGIDIVRQPGALLPKPDEGASKATNIGYALSQAAVNLISPESLATILVAHGVGAGIAKVIDNPALGQALKNYPIIAKAFNLAARAPVPGYFAFKGTKGALESGARANAAPEGSNERTQARTQEVIDAVMAMAGAYGVNRAATTAFPKGELPPAEISTKSRNATAAEVLEQARPADIPPEATRPNPALLPEAVKSEKAATALEGQGRYIAAGQWLARAEKASEALPQESFSVGGKNYTARITGAQGNTPIFSLIDESGKSLMSGNRGDVAQFVRDRLARTPEPKLSPELDEAMLNNAALQQAVQEAHERLGDIRAMEEHLATGQDVEMGKLTMEHTTPAERREMLSENIEAHKENYEELWTGLEKDLGIDATAELRRSVEHQDGSAGEATAEPALTEEQLSALEKQYPGTDFSKTRATMEQQRAEAQRTPPAEAFARDPKSLAQPGEASPQMEGGGFQTALRLPGGPQTQPKLGPSGTLQSSIPTAQPGSAQPKQEGAEPFQARGPVQLGNNQPLNENGTASSSTIHQTLPEQKPAEKHEYSSTQVNLPPEIAEPMRNAVRYIPDFNLAEDGREAEPHITVKYGLHGEDPEAVRKLLANEPPITATLGKTSLFENDDADVLKVDIKSSDLERINKQIAAALPNTDTHPDYQPHATLAYLKPGKGKLYAGQDIPGVTGQTVTLNSITFSGKDGKTVEIPLKGTPQESGPTSSTSTTQARSTPEKGTPEAKIAAGLKQEPRPTPATQTATPIAASQPFEAPGIRMPRGPAAAKIEAGIKQPEPISNEETPAPEGKPPATSWMNHWDVDEAVDRYKNHPVLSRATRFLRDLRDETDANSDGWAHWSLPSHAASQLQGIIQHPEYATEENFKRALAPIRAFYTKRGNAAGMKFPEIAPATPQAKIEAGLKQPTPKPQTAAEKRFASQKRIAEIEAELKAKAEKPAEMPAVRFDPFEKTPPSSDEQTAAILKFWLGEIESSLIRVQSKSGTSHDERVLHQGPLMAQRIANWMELHDNARWGREHDAVAKAARETLGASITGKPYNHGHAEGMANHYRPYVAEMRERLTNYENGRGFVTGEKPAETPTPAPAAPALDDIDAAIAKALEAKIGKPPAPKGTPEAKIQAGTKRSPGVRTAAEIDAGKKQTKISAGLKPKTTPLTSASDAAKERMRARLKGSTLHVGIDPQDMIDLATIGAESVLQGAIKFKDWLKRFMGEVGDLVHGVGKYSQKTPAQVISEIHPRAARAAKAYGHEAEAAPSVEEIERMLAPEEETTSAPSHDGGGAAGLMQAVYEKLKAGESLGNVTELNKLAEKAFGSSRTSGAWTPKDAFDAMEAGVNKLLIERGKNLLGMPFGKAMAELRELMGRLTSQGTRTEEQIKAQQFSTPPTESFLVAKVADLKPTDVVAEPSAGNGGLAVWPKAIGAEVHVNEISDRRRQMLALAGFGEATAHDGEIINALLDRAIKPTVILMNPPFTAGVVKSGPAKNSQMYGFNHVDSALQRLAPGGRLVAILGGGQANEPEGGASLSGIASRAWFERLAKDYNVRANVRIHGREYQKYGTAFATRVIVIDKDGPTASLDNIVKGNVDTVDEAYNLLQDVANSRPTPRQAGASSDSGPRKGVTGTRLGTGARPGAAGDTGVLPGEHGDSPAPELGAESRPTAPDGSARGVAPGEGPELPARDESGPGSAQPAGAATAEGIGSSDQDATLERPAPVEPAETLHLENLDQPQHTSDEEDSEAYVKYKPVLSGPAHPGPIVETKTMATVPMPPITYQPALPQSVVENGTLSAVQLEAIAIAGQQNAIILPGGFRGSALIGDGTGVGKGRISAGILWDNYRRGRKRLVWVSEKWDLMQAAMADFHNIGATELTRGITKEPSGRFTAGPTAAVVPFNRFNAKAKIEHDGVIFTTYALIRSEDKGGRRRVAQLEEWLKGEDEADGAYVLFDESHNLKNAVASGRQQVSQIGEKTKALLEHLPKLRTASLSATAATDVVNLGYLDRLGIWGPGTAFPNGFREFQSQVAGGGISAMELIARELKAQGKYVARTLSFHGVVYREKDHKLTNDQKELYRTAAKAWGVVFANIHHTINTVTNGGAAQSARAMSQFYGAQQRFFNLLITTLKIPTAVEEANKALADNKSVVLTLINTNEAAQNREKNKASDQDPSEDEIPDYDFGPKEMLIDYVRQNYPIQQYRDDVDGNGNPIKVPVYETDAEGREIPVTNPEAVRLRDELIAEVNRDLHMPDNPLDILVQSLGGAKKVAEITGRKEYFDRDSGKFVPRGDPNTPRKEINLVEMRNFQAGKKRVAILSGAGGTGISLHAGNDVANQQQRVHITLQVGWSADKQMQFFGRTHRTNQKHAPEYVMLVSDLGGERRFVSTISRRLGSLGALTKGQKNASGGTDLMEKCNFETDQGRAATNTFYTALLRDVAIPGSNLTGLQVLTDLHVLKRQSDGSMSVPREDRTNVTRLLNRMLALDPDVQNSAYNYFYDIFQEAVRRAIADGSLDTGVRTLRGDEFDVKENRVISVDPKTGAETYYYPVDVQTRTDRVSPKELEKQMREHRGDHPRILFNPENKHIGLFVDARPIVHADGSVDPASYYSRPEDGHWVKIANAEFSQRMRDPEEWATEEVQKAKHEVSSAERTIEWQKSALERATAEGRGREEAKVQRKLTGLEERLADLEHPPAADIVVYGGKKYRRIRSTYRGRTTRTLIQDPQTNREYGWVDEKQLSRPFIPTDRGPAIIEAKADIEQTKAELEAAREQAKTFELPADNWERKHLAEGEETATEARKALADAEAIAKDPHAWIKNLWREQYEAAPSHITTEHHLIGGAVMRFWNPIRDAAGFGNNIYTATDTKTKQRVVGVDIPAAAIRALLERITGNASTVNARQLYLDVLRNNLQYTLEGNIQVRRGRIGRQEVIQLIPPTGDISENLKRLGVLYEKGIQPVYYVPNSDTGPSEGRTAAILDRVLAEYPVKPEEPTTGDHSSERGSTPASLLTAPLVAIFGGPEGQDYSGLGARKTRFVRGLSQLEKASPEAHMAAVKAATSRAQTAALLNTAVPVIEKAMKAVGGDTAPNWLQLRMAMIQSRLMGLTDRWDMLADKAADAADKDLAGAMGQHLIGLLDNIEGKRGVPETVSETAAAFAASHDWPNLSVFLAQTFRDASHRVASILTPDEYDDLTHRPGFKEGLKSYKSLIESKIADNHASNEGIFSTALGPLKTYYPLVPVTDEDHAQGRSGRAVPYRKPKNIANKFASGLAEDGYDPTMEALADRLRQAFRVNNKAALMQVLAETGVARRLKKGQPAPETIWYQGRELKANVVETVPDKMILGGGKVVFVPAGRAVIAAAFRDELKPILEGDMRLYNPKHLLAHITQYTLAGPTDLVIHAANLIGTLVARTPYLGTSLADKAVSIPFVKRIAATLKIAWTDPTTPEAAHEIAEMAEIGLIPERFGQQTYSKKYAEQTGAELKRLSLGPTLYGPKGVDIRARLYMYRLAKAINPEATPQQLYLYVNQLGNYTKSLQGTVERTLKNSMFSPFYTAGSTMLRNGINSWTGMGPMPKDGPGLRAWQAITGGALGLIATWILIHKAYDDKYPWEAKAPLLGLVLKPEHRNSAIGQALFGPPSSGRGIVNLGWGSPLVMRGARALGIAGAWNTAMKGGNWEQSLESAIAGSVSAAVAPAAGPPVRAITTGLFGVDPTLMATRDRSGEFKPQFFTVLKKQPMDLHSVGARVAGSVMTMNGFYKNVGVAVGLGDSILKESDDDANRWVKMIADLAMPQLIGRPEKLEAAEKSNQQQRNAASGTSSRMSRPIGTKGLLGHPLGGRR